jgi:hypothetical protein
LGIPAYTFYEPAGGTRFRSFVNEKMPRTASIPTGYGIRAYTQSIKAGGMSAYGKEIVTGTFIGNLLQGGPMSGTGSMTLSGDNMNLSLVISMAGTGTIILSGDNCELKLTMGLSGTGSIELTGDDNSLSMIIPLAGIGTIELTGISDLRGKLSLSGEWTPYTTLSPENLAAAVWNAVAASYNTSGSMGEKLNDAGSASNPWTEVLEGTYTAAELLRIMSAVLAGKTSGAGGTEVTFRDLLDLKDRIIGTVDTEGNRTEVVIDGE